MNGDNNENDAEETADIVEEENEDAVGAEEIDNESEEAAQGEEEASEESEAAEEDEQPPSNKKGRFQSHSLLHHFQPATINLTESEKQLTALRQSAAKVAQPRRVVLLNPKKEIVKRNVKGRGASTKLQGARVTDARCLKVRDSKLSSHGLTSMGQAQDDDLNSPQCHCHRHFCLHAVRLLVIR